MEEDRTRRHRMRRSRHSTGGSHRIQRSPGIRRLLFYVRAMMLLCVAAIAVFAGLLIHNGGEYARGDAAYEQVRSILQTQPATAAASTVHAPTAAAAAPTGPAAGAKMNFAALQGINNDVVGWLSAQGRTIDYPIVLGEDNAYYLTHLFDRRRNKLGSLFMDYRNHGDFSDKSTVIYGHNMKDGSMFASLTFYKDQKYYDSFPDTELYTPDGDYRIVFFAGIVADGDYEFVRFSFEDDTDFLRYIASLKEKSTFMSGIEVQPDDRIVTLCTCSYEYNNARFALFGKLEPTE